MRKVAFAWFSLSTIIVIAMLLAAEFPSSTTATFRTENIIVDDTSNLGSVNGVTNINGPTRQTIVVPGGTWPYGEINLKDVSGVGTPFPADVFVDVIRNSTSFDCTTNAQHSGAMSLQISGTRSAGAFDLTNTALELSATGGQNNEALRIFNGDFTFDGTGAITQNSGTAFFAGTYLATSSATHFIAQNNGDYSILINNNPTDSIRTASATASWNTKNAGASTLKLWNEDNTFTLDIAGPVLHTLWRPEGIVAPSAGAFTTGSTTMVGGLTGVGATSTVITYTTAFSNRSRCYATLASTTPQVITAIGTSTTCTFRCFDMAGVAANCEDFSYLVVGQ